MLLTIAHRYFQQRYYSNMTNTSKPMKDASSSRERFKRGAADAGRFFTYIAEFVGFTTEDAAAIKASRFIIEKHIPDIVGAFYAQLMRFPATRKPFLRKDGTVDQAYLEMRMQHQIGFWRRAASAEFDEDFARFTDYVGRAHTSKGADPNVYIPQRYVIGMIGFVQRRITEALGSELRAIDADLEARATKAWTTFTLVLLEMFSRPYVNEGEAPAEKNAPVDAAPLLQLAVNTYERSLGIARTITYADVVVAHVDEIPDGGRKVVDVNGLSIGVFHHDGKWIALQNSCLHRGGPVCEGALTGHILTCPWHGYEYDVRTGQLLLDPDAFLTTYQINVRDGQVYLRVPTFERDTPDVDLNQTQSNGSQSSAVVQMKENEFSLSAISPGQAKRVMLDGKAIAVYNVEGNYYATADECTHARGPLSEGRIEGMNIICPWHDSCFDVRTGEATCRPAKKPVQVYRVVVDGAVGRVEA
jgi:nitrite reductase/ring-hydroxylating ferredoxin subunit